MHMSMILFMLFALGCAASPDRGEVATRRGAEELVQHAGVVRFYRQGDEGGHAGNAIAVAEDLFLAPAHMVPATRGTCQQLRLDDHWLIAEVVAEGDPQASWEDWKLLRTVWGESPPVGAAAAIGPKPVTGQDVVIVGYWYLEPGEPAPDDRYPVLARGIVVDPPFGLGEFGETVIFVEAGDPGVFHGLSGSAVMTQDSTGTWRVVGLFAGFWRGHLPWDTVNFVVPWPSAAIDAAIMIDEHASREARPRTGAAR